jgi:FkbM family methyltransferase
MTEMVPVPICGREDWTVLMPEERAGRVQWPWHEWNRFHSMFHNLRPGDVLFDVGAEQGDQSALYARWVQGVEQSPLHPTVEALRATGGIVLIEPNPVAWPNIRTVWEANDLRDPLACFDLFVANQTGGHQVTAWGSWPLCSRYAVAKYVGTAEINERSTVTTLDSIAGEVGAPDAITVDIEGGELDALRGAMGMLTLDKPLVWVSIHWQLLLERGQSRAELIGYMDSLGYRHEHLGQDHEIHALFWHPEGRPLVLPYDNARLS